MNNLSRLTSDVSKIATAYESDGYFSPYDVTSEQEAAELQADLEAAEAELASDRSLLSMLRGYPARLLPSFDRLIRNPRLLAVANNCWAPTCWYGAAACSSRSPTPRAS